jgi:hypothetical protein
MVRLGGGTQEKKFHNYFFKYYQYSQKAGTKYGAPWRGGSRIEFLSNFGSKSSEQ